MQATTAFVSDLNGAEMPIVKMVGGKVPRAPGVEPGGYPDIVNFLIVSCLDVRIRESTYAVLDRVSEAYGADRRYNDLMKFPGGAFAVFQEPEGQVARAIPLLVDKHGLQGVILMAHMDCAVVKGVREFSSVGEEINFLRDMLTRTTGIVRKMIPSGVVIDSYLVNHNGVEGVCLCKVTPTDIKSRVTSGS